MAIRSSKTSTAVAIPIDVVGSDLMGQQFIERTQTVTITRDGATISLRIKLAPESELIIRNLATNEEAFARVVGHIREEGVWHVYGVALAPQSTGIWRVEFPAADANEKTLLECSCCHTVRAVSLTDIEKEILESDLALTRLCERSSSATLWKPTTRSVSTEPEKTFPHKDSSPAPPTTAKAERRREKRTAMKRSACIRHNGKEEVVTCEDMSRGGFRFKSRKAYPEGTRIEAAVPYAASSVNIFVPARIAYHQIMPDGLHRHGVSYITTGAPVD